MSPFLPVLTRIAEALERLSPPAPSLSLTAADAFLWQTEPDSLIPIPEVQAISLKLLKGIDRQKQALLDNTRQFIAGFSANNALLWGARGTGKSSLVKAVHAYFRPDLVLVELARDDLPSLPRLLRLIRQQSRRVVIFCDDLSFENQDADYKSLKAVLDGGLEGRPEQVLFYATSNRRHLLSRSMMENEQATAINPGEAVEEKVSLSDRFGLWIGFHNTDQDTWLAMVDGYAAAFGITDKIDPNDLHAQALEWSITRGARSGRVAWQFIQDLAGKLGIAISNTYADP